MTERGVLLFLAGFATAVAALATTAELHERSVRKAQAKELAELDKVAGGYRSVPKVQRADRIYPSFGESEYR